jgi:hypothetical protein
MERPSHIIFDTHQSLSHRLPLLGLAASLQIAIFWLFTHGLGSGVVHSIIHDIELQPFKEKVDTGPKPPPIDVQTQKRIELPPVTPLIFNTAREPGSTAITTTPANTTTTQSAGADRAPVSIAATHTVPPYPGIAQRRWWLPATAWTWTRRRKPGSCRIGATGPRWTRGRRRSARPWRRCGVQPERHALK